MDFQILSEESDGKSEMKNNQICNSIIYFTLCHLVKLYYSFNLTCDRVQENCDLIQHVPDIKWVYCAILGLCKCEKLCETIFMVFQNCIESMIKDEMAPTIGRTILLNISCLFLFIKQFAADHTEGYQPLIDMGGYFQKSYAKFQNKNFPPPLPSPQPIVCPKNAY